MSKFIDLAPRIKRDHMTGPITGLDGETYTLQWLDDHPELTGRTITESEWVTATRELHGNTALGFKLGLNFAGITVTPDSEPTNAEKLEAHLLDLLGVVEAIGNTGVHNMAYELDRAGVTALGGRDE